MHYEVFRKLKARIDTIRCILVGYTTKQTPYFLCYSQIVCQTHLADIKYEVRTISSSTFY